MNTSMGPIAGRVVPCGLAFFASFCIMVVEVVAGRIIARHVGHSLYTWTSVIGVVLAGITIGNLIGGRLADRFSPRGLLPLIFLGASLTCLVVPVLNEWAGESPWLRDLGEWRTRVAAHVTVVFLLPSTILGLAGPVVAKLALDQGFSTGATVGNVYAWGALGSIVGTFATGFFLIPLLKTSGIVFGTAGILAIAGTVLLPFYVWPLSLAIVFGSFIVTGSRDFWERNLELSWIDGIPTIREKPTADTVFMDESQYSFVQVTEDETDGTRDLVLDNLVHAHYVPGEPLDLRYEYELVYAAVTERYAGDREMLRTFFVGGGGYIFPRYIRARWPGSLAEVAEIDPMVTQAAIEALGLGHDEVRILASRGSRPEEPATASAANPRPIDVYHLDARNHVDDLLRRKREGSGFEPFDYVYGDAFNDFSVPYHLVTREFTEKVRDLLRPVTGIYLLNVIDTYASAEFVGSVYCTFRDVFGENTYVFVTDEDGPSDDPEQRDTFVVIGALQSLDLSDLEFAPAAGVEVPMLLARSHLRSLEEKAAGRVLTDDYAPVENLLEAVVKTRH